MADWTMPHKEPVCAAQGVGVFVIQPNTPVILANLTPVEYDAIWSTYAHLGADSPDASPNPYGGLAPYVSMHWSDLPAVLAVVGWTAWQVSLEGDLVVRRASRDGTRPSVLDRLAALERRLADRVPAAPSARDRAATAAALRRAMRETGMPVHKGHDDDGYGYGV